jgi:hypothetical protein
MSALRALWRSDGGEAATDGDGDADGDKLLVFFCVRARALGRAITITTNTIATISSRRSRVCSITSQTTAAHLSEEGRFPF